MTTFFNSTHCRSEAHCTLCRDQLRGQRWRASLVPVFSDVKLVDFECPHGQSWGAIKLVSVAAQAVVVPVEHSVDGFSIPLLTPDVIIAHVDKLHTVLPDSHAIFKAIAALQQKQTDKGCKGCMLNAYMTRLMAAVYTSSMEDQVKIKQVIENG